MVLGLALSSDLNVSVDDPGAGYLGARRHHEILGTAMNAIVDFSQPRKHVPEVVNKILDGVNRARERDRVDTPTLIVRFKEFLRLVVADSPH